MEGIAGAVAGFVVAVVVRRFEMEGPLYWIVGSLLAAACSEAVWFVSSSPTGPWVVADTVPAVIYTIPPSSPLHYVTYVRVYGYTPQVVYTGYTPGYLGTVVNPYGTVVYGTGYAYTPWVGSVWYPAPYTYGYAEALAEGAAIASRRLWGRKAA